MRKIIKNTDLVPIVIQDLILDSTPTEGSTNPVTSDGVKGAIDGAVGDASEALQEQIDDIAEKAGSGYIPKGEASVATLNALSGQENGDLYTMTDAGTLTDGSLAVVAGDTVAWDETNSVWYKAMDYAPRQYGTNEVHNLPTTITAFRTGDVIPVDGPSGTAKMSKDTLLAITAENAKSQLNDYLELCEPSPNLFDVESPENSIDKFVFSDGTLVDNTSYNSSGYIEVTAGETYTFSAQARSVCFYDSSKAYKSYSTYVNSFTVPSGAAFLRFSATKTIWADDFMLVEGSELPETYIKGGFIIKGSSLPYPNIPNNYISLEQVKFSEPSPNLFNISDPDVALGKYLNNGALSDNPSYNTSGYIKVTAGESYKFSSQVRCVAYYYNGTSYYSTEQYKTSVTVPSGCNALRFSVAVADWQYFMMVHGSDLPANFEPFGQTISPSALPKVDNYLSDIVGGMAVVSSMGSSAKISTYDSVNANDTIQLTDVPKDPKNGLYFSCRFEFSAFTSFKIGKGYNSYRGAWIEIDGTNIVCKRYESAVIVVGTVAHGLTLSDYIAVSVSTSSDSKWKVMLNTSSGMFTTEFQLNYEFCGTAFATFGSASTSVKIDFGNACYKEPVWLFGDSYVGIDNPQRWPYYLNQQGYLNIMMNGLAGRGSAAAFSDFENSLKYGCPKYVIWCMGMNDVAATWLENFNKVKRLCEQNGIELILATIPTTPTQDKEAITGYVMSSGLRYIDFYSAVGTDSSGNWYSGMLAGDQVHPTALGAEALAAQVLVDFPEIMQFD